MRLLWIAAPIAAVALPFSAQAQQVTEGFSNVSTLSNSGWVTVNQSSPIGTQTNWFHGNTSTFNAQAGTAGSYISANRNFVAGDNTINGWLLTPEVDIGNGLNLTFWTRTIGTPVRADRIEVRVSFAGSSTDVGTDANSVGDFTTLLTTINPNLVLSSGYPTTWTQYTVYVTGLSQATTGRFAFRYHVTNGGPSGANSDVIGIDTVSIGTAYCGDGNLNIGEE